MAGFVQSTIGSGTGTSIDSNAFGTDPTAGNMIVVGVEVEGLATLNTSVTDNAGNTYTTDNNVSAVGQSIKLWKAYNISSTSSFVVTVHNTVSTSTGFICHEFLGPGTSDPFDKTASATGSGTALDSGSTATLSQGDEIVIGFGTIDNVDTLTTGSGYSNGVSTTSSNFRLRLESKVVSSTTAVNATLTANSSGSWKMMVATYKLPLTAAQINKSDSVTITENINQTLVNNLSVSDSSTITENVVVRSELNINVSDSTTITESIDVTRNGSRDLSVSDNSTITESVQLLNSENINVTDSSTIAENVQLSPTNFINVSDNATITESLKMLETGFINVADTTTISEALLLQDQEGIAIMESVAISESVNLLIEIKINVSDTTTITEYIQTNPASAINVSDITTITESIGVAFADGFQSVFFNGIDIGGLGDTSINRIDTHNRPVRGLTNYKLARLDGSKLVDAQYIEKVITIGGYIAASDRLTYEIDRDILMRWLQPQEVTLLLTQAGMSRIYTATVENVIWSTNEGGFGVFDIQFLCSAPFGQDTTTTTLLSSVAITTATSIQTITSIGGTYKALPTITVVVTAVTGGTTKFIKITNPSNGKAITITRTWTNSDSLVIDCINQTAKVNGTLVDYSGVFPEWFVGDIQVQYDDNFSSRTVALSFSYTRRYL